MITRRPGFWGLPNYSGGRSITDGSQPRKQEAPKEETLRTPSDQEGLIDLIASEGVDISPFLACGGIPCGV